jgi:hypothetical protein
MPTDHVKNRTFKETLSGTVRFKIPFFQRGYRWEKKQWDQLFIDLQEQIIEELDRGSTVDQVEHFFGPIVVMEQTGMPELKEFLVIAMVNNGSPRFISFWESSETKSGLRSTCPAMPTATSTT